MSLQESPPEEEEDEPVGDSPPAAAAEAPAKGKKPLTRRRRLYAAILFVAHIAGALSSVKAVMDVRTSQGAIAWAISLNTIPLVAVPAYWVFGRSKFEGYVVARRQSDDEARTIREQFMTALADQDLVAVPGEQRPLFAEKLAGLPFTRGNDVELLIDGDETFASINEGIGRAKDYVLVQFYIIHDDDTGRAMKDALIAKAKEGVRCRLLYDEIGTRMDKKSTFFEDLKDAGVEVYPFNTTQGKANRFQLNFRNHRKIVVVDGKEAWVGGLNVGDEYKGLDPKFGYWRDTHLHLTGPVVPCIQVSFAEDWHWAAKKRVGGLNFDPVPAESDVSQSVLCLPTGPADQLEYCTLFFLSTINAATERLWIATPYFVPDEQFISALQLAKLRGVDVKILIPEKSDSKLIQFSHWSFLEELEAAGIEVFHYEKGFMHHKVVLVDDEFASVGTANFDNRSFRLNFEITMGIVDREFNRQVAAMLEDDFSNARRVSAQELKERGFPFRLAVQVARLTAPIQ